MAEQSQIVITVDRETLKFFRAECIRRDTTPTKEVAAFIVHQLRQWQQGKTPGPSHALT